MNPASLRLSIIIPVYDRRARLEACLASLARCEFDAPAELIVVNDGSREDYGPLVEAWNGPAEARYLFQENAGPARARNYAVRESRGEIILFLNDDIRLEPNVLRAHDAVHRRLPGHAVMGNTRWAPEVVANDFMHWVAQHDHLHQELEALDDIGPTYWHTLNASIDRRWFAEEDEWFSEAFPSPALEDTEYSYRLAKKGLRVALAGDAIVWHVHVFELRDYVWKSHMRGRCARVFCDLHPEAEEWLLREYREAAEGDVARSLWWRDLLRKPDGPAEWHARFALAYLAGFDGAAQPPSRALRIR